MVTANSSQLLHLKDVAEELNSKPLAVLRLIAWEVLEASRLAGPDPWRITRAALDRYIESGSPKAEMPPTRQAWLDEELRFHSGRLVEAIERAARPQFLSVDQVRQRTEAQPGPLPDIVLQASPEIRAVFDGPAPESQLAEERKKYAGKFASWGQLHVMNQMRAQAQRVIQGMELRSIESPLKKLYASPDDFKAILKATHEAVLERKFVFADDHHWRTEKIEGQYNEVVVENHRARVTYVLPWNSLLNNSDLARHAELAF